MSWMVRSWMFRLITITLALAAGFAGPTDATTYVMMSDGDLADGAEAIVYGRVLSVGMSPDDPQGTTRYLFEVERVVKGLVAGPTLEIDVPGGLPRRDGTWQMVWGMPRFDSGERALLFVHARDRGGYGIHQLLLGAFHEIRVGDRVLAMRPLALGTELGPEGKMGPGRDSARDLHGFMAWLEARAAGAGRSADYLVAVTPSESGQLTERVRIFESGGKYMRRFDFDDGGTVRFEAHQDGQSGMAGGGLDHVQKAMKAWTDDPGSNIRLAMTTGATQHPITCGPPNTISFDDPFNDIGGAFDCERGGVLAFGGGCISPEISYGGYEFLNFFKGFIVTQNGAGCVMGANGGTTGQEVFAHELGHTLALGHSCGSGTRDPDCEDAVLGDALMRPFVHGDGRGARLNADDRAGIEFLYADDVRAGWWRHTSYPGYRFQIEISQGGGQSILGAPMVSCIDETVCVSGALPGRAEIFTRIIGPRPNGKLWPTLVKFTTSEVTIRIEQVATGIERTYVLAGARPGVDELPGRFDREGFDPP